MVLIPAALLVMVLIPAASAGQTYTVSRGDTLGTIAREFNTTVNLLVSANDIEDINRIEVGQELTIPTIYSAYRAPQTYRSRALTGVNSAYSLRPRRSAYVSAYNNTTYQVAYGDTLAKIAGKYDITIDSIRDSNNLYSDLIYVGQELVIPQEAASVSTR